MVGVLKALTAPGVWTPVGVGGISQVDADARFVNVPGDTMTGRLIINMGSGGGEAIRLADTGNATLLAFYNSTLTTRNGYLMGTSADVRLASDVGSVYLIGQGGVNALVASNIKVASLIPFQSQVPADFWSANSSQIFFGTIGHVGTDGSNRVGIYSNTYRNASGGSTNGGGFTASAAVECDPTGVIMFRCEAGIPTGTGPANVARITPTVFEIFADPLYVGGQFRAFLDGLTALLAGSNGTSYLGFYTNATSYSAVGTRSGYVGFSSANNLLLNNEMSGGMIYIDCGASGGNIIFRFGGGEQFRMSPQAILVGKTAYNTYQTVSGMEMWSADGQLMLTQSTNTFSSMVHIGAADAAAISYWRFYRTGTSLIGQIRQVATSGVEYLTTSDKRLKTFVRGTDDDESLAILRALAPVHYTWNHAPDDGERIGFFAQDLYPLAPEAVGVGSGEPGDDDFEPWGTDLAKLMPRVVAILQAIDRRLTALEAA